MGLLEIVLCRNSKKSIFSFLRPSFHVGSGCTDPETFVQAISDARCVFDMGVSTCKPGGGGGGRGRAVSDKRLHSRINLLLKSSHIPEA